MDGGAPQAAVEDGFGDGWANGPEAAGPGKPFREGRTFEAAFGVQRQRRIVGGIGDADRGIGFRHGAFSGGDIWAAFEELRRHAYRNWRRSEGHGLHGNREVRRLLAYEHGDGVLELGPRDSHI